MGFKELLSRAGGDEGGLLGREEFPRRHIVSEIAEALEVDNGSGISHDEGDGGEVGDGGE